MQYKVQKFSLIFLFYLRFPLQYGFILQKAFLCLMGIITVVTPFNIDLEFVTAPIQRRIGAVLLDMIIIMLYMLVVYHFVIISFDIGSKMSELVMMAGLSILPFLYFPLCEIMMNGQTPGKRLLGIKVIDNAGNEPSISQYLLRWLLGFGNYSVFLLPYVIVTSSTAFLLMLFFCFMAICCFYFIDFICSIVSTKNQRLADLAAGTVVIDVKRKMNFSETIYREISEDDAAAQYPQVLQLSDKDINGIKNLLNKNPKGKVELDYRKRIVTRIKEVIHITEDHSDDKAFLEQLLKDYNLLTQRK